MEKNLFFRIHALLKSAKALKGLALLLLFCLTAVVGKAEEVELYSHDVTINGTTYSGGVIMSGEVNSTDKTATITNVIFSDELNEYVATIEPGAKKVTNSKYFTTFGVVDLIFPSEVNYDDETYTVIAIMNNDNSTVSESHSIVYDSNSTQDNILYIKSITIPSSVKKLGDKCFLRCWNLAQINLSEGLESIGDYCFSAGHTYQAYKTALTSVNIPASVKTIGVESFARSHSLTSVNFANNSQLTAIGDRCFYTYANRTKTYITSIILPAKLETIGTNAFYSNDANITLKTIVYLGTNTLSNLPENATVYKYSNSGTSGITMLGYRTPGNVYGTVCYPKAISLENSVGVKALYGEKSDEKHGLADDHSLITMTEVTSPVAGTPYIFERSSEDTEDNLVIFVPADANETEAELNDGTYLKGTYEKTDYSSLDSSHGLYIMQKGVFKKMGSSNWLNANTAYLDLGETTAASKPIAINFEESETTGINSAIIESTKADGVKYNLQGQRILKPAAGQLYIMNGRKYIAK